MHSAGSGSSSDNVSVTASKASANWERKSAYLLSELTKFQLYVDSLKVASKLRAEKRDQRELNRMMRQADEGMSQVKITDDETGQDL